MVPWRYITSASFFGAEPLSPSSCVTGNNRNLYGGSIKSYHIATWNKFFADLQAFYASNLNAQSSIFFIQQFSKDVVQAVPDDATAYPHRDITAHLFVTPWLHLQASTDSCFVLTDSGTLAITIPLSKTRSMPLLGGPAPISMPQAALTVFGCM